MTSPFALLLLPIVALVAVGCGSDGESISSEPVEVATTQPATTEPATTQPATTATAEPAATDASDSAGPGSTEAGAPLAGGIEVDDDPVCRAFARLFAASFFQELTGSFGADDGAVEKTELYFAPALAPDVVVIRTQGAPEFQALPTLARIEAGIVALTAGGFTDSELVALAASGGDTIDGILAGSEPDLESVATAPEAETKLAAATEAYLAEVGTIDEFFEANADPVAEAAFTERLSAQCPTLVASFESA